MKLLIGGSPCTRWSIARTFGRETKPEGIGWELFENYLITKEKFKPDYFLYENNKSMSKEIRAQITRELGVEPILINSALVSAQSRQRLYWNNIPNVGQPEDRNILLADILETGVPWREKAYTLKATAGTHGGPSSVLRSIKQPGHFTCNGAAEPIRIGTIESGIKNPDWDSKAYRVYSPEGKSVTLCGQGGGIGAKTGLYAVKVDDYEFIKGETSENGMLDFLGGLTHENTGKWLENGKAFSRNFRQGSRLYGINGKSATVTAQSSGISGHAGLYAVPAEEYGVSPIEKNPTPVYLVKDGKILIGFTWYPIRLADGFYIIRKLTVTECKRLQTAPDDYVFPVSNSQAYKMLGNGWTVDVIAHILHCAPRITAEPLNVLSMYDGMSCGRIALNKLGANVEKYYATEIDKYAIQTTLHNFPDTIQLGDAFQVREDDWKLPM